MKAFKLIGALILFTVVAACNQYSVATSSGSRVSGGSSSSSSGSAEITLSGTSGHGELAGDKIEIKEGTVLVNGVSFGAVPAGAEVKYSVNAEDRALFVGGERRSAAR